MAETIAQIIGFIIQTVLICFYGILSYRLGHRAGVNATIIKVLKDEGIVTKEE